MTENKKNVKREKKESFISKLVQENIDFYSKYGEYMMRYGR